ncbi:hypothetical protein BKA62DRAFT_833440, partial [Auriculariales sp. MPI-PUGE-AT-0066]
TARPSCLPWSASRFSLSSLLSPHQRQFQDLGALLVTLAAPHSRTIQLSSCTELLHTDGKYKGSSDFKTFFSIIVVFTGLIVYSLAILAFNIAELSACQ